MPPCRTTWSPRKLWKSTQITASSSSLERNLIKTEATRLSEISSGCFSTLLCSPQASLSMNLHLLPPVSTEWSSSASQSTIRESKKNSLISRNRLSPPLLLKAQTRWKKSIDDSSICSLSSFLLSHYSFIFTT